MEDSRRAVRISTNLKLVTLISGNSTDTRILNMSCGGVFIKTDRLLPVDAELTINLQLPGDPDIMAIGSRVVWTKAVSQASPAGMGIQFVEILPDYERKISAFVEANIKQPNSDSAVKMYI